MQDAFGHAAARPSARATIEYLVYNFKVGTTSFIDLIIMCYLPST